MLGHVTESIDYNLPVDAITRKPVFAFSLNRAIRENYSGQYFDYIDANGTGSYPEREPILEGTPMVTKIYDQKVRHEHTAKDIDVVNGFLGIDQNGYYLEFFGDGYASIPIGQYFTDEAGVLVVCDPDNNQGRAPVFSANNSVNELCFDVGNAYMRFDHYNISDSHKLFGGIDSPDSSYNGYLGNFSDVVDIKNPTGFSGRSVRRLPIDSLDTAYLFRDVVNFFHGKVYEMVITDFKIPSGSVDEVFTDWISFYSLT